MSVVCGLDVGWLVVLPSVVQHCAVELQLTVEPTGVFVIDVVVECGCGEHCCRHLLRSAGRSEEARS